MTEAPQTGDAAFTLRVPICKIDDEKRRVFGFSSIISDPQGALTFDFQGTQIPIAELEEASFDYVKAARGVGDQHERTGVGDLIVSMPLTPDMRKAAGLPEGQIGWFVGFQVHDESVWKRIKSGELSELSIGGSAVKDFVE